MDDRKSISTSISEIFKNNLGKMEILQELHPNEQRVVQIRKYKNKNW